MERIMCSCDPHFIELASEGIEHNGIVFGEQDMHSIGDWVRFLALMHAVYEPDEMSNQLQFLIEIIEAQKACSNCRNVMHPPHSNTN